MKIECDTTMIRTVAKNLDTDAKRYKEVMKQFYSIINSLTETSIWMGTASNNYVRYLNAKSKNYGELYNKMEEYVKILNANVDEMEYAIKNLGEATHDEDNV